jgi:hypothetical protein
VACQQATLTGRPQGPAGYGLAGSRSSMGRVYLAPCVASIPAHGRLTGGRRSLGRFRR